MNSQTQFPYGSTPYQPQSTDQPDRKSPATYELTVPGGMGPSVTVLPDPVPNPAPTLKRLGSSALDSRHVAPAVQVSPSEDLVTPQDKPRRDSDTKELETPVPIAWQDWPYGRAALEGQWIEFEPEMVHDNDGSPAQWSDAQATPVIASTPRSPISASAPFEPTSSPKHEEGSPALDSEAAEEHPRGKVIQDSDHTMWYWASSSLFEKPSPTKETSWSEAGERLAKYRDQAKVLLDRLFVEKDSKSGAVGYAVETPWTYSSEDFSAEQWEALQADLTKSCEPFVAECREMSPGVLGMVRHKLAHSGGNVRGHRRETAQQQFITALLLRASYFDNDPVAFISRTSQDLACRDIHANAFGLRQEAHFREMLRLVSELMPWNIPADSRNRLKGLDDAPLLRPILFAEPNPGRKPTFVELAAPAGEPSSGLEGAPAGQPAAPAQMQPQPQESLGEVSTEVHLLEKQLGIQSGVSSSSLEFMTARRDQLRHQLIARELR